MEKDKMADGGDLYSKLSSTNAEANLPPSQILQAVSGGSLEGVATTRAALNQAVEEYRQGNYENAASILLKLIKALERTIARPAGGGTADLEDPTLLLASADTTLGRTYMQLGRGEEAQMRFAEAVALFDRSLRPGVTVGAQSHSDYGIALFMVGRKDEAVASLQQAHALGSKTAETFFYLGVSFKEQTKYKEAEGCLKEALDAAPGDASTQQLLAEVLEIQGPERYREAVQSYIAAAFALGASHQFERALKLLDHALVLQPDTAVLLMMKAELLRLLGNYEEAVRVVDQALPMDSAELMGQLFTTRAGALQGLSRFEEALQDVDKSLAHNPANATALGVKGQVLHSLGRNEEALSILKQSIELESDMDWVQAELGAVQFDLGSYEQALDSADAALKLNPKNAWALYLKGETLRNVGRFQDALEVFDQALALRPDSPLLLIPKAEVLRALERREMALAVIDQAVAVLPSAGVLGMKGEILHEMDRLEDAIKVFRQSIEVDPNQSWAHRELGESLFQVGQVDEALKSFDAALQLNPDDPWTLRAKAKAFASQNKHDEAIPLLQHLIGIDPSPADYSELFESLQATQKFEEALDVLDKGAQLALERNPNDTTIMVMRGQVLNAVGRYDDAIAVLEQSLAINPDLEAAHTELGSALLEKEKYDEALLELDHALTLNENNAKALASKGRLLFEQSRDEEAIRYLRRSAELDSEEALTCITLGRALRQTGEYDEALKVLDKGLKLDPENALGLLTRAQVLHSLGRLDEALLSIKQAIELAPESYSAHAELGSILFDQRQNDAALLAVNEALRLDPKNVFALGTKADILQTIGDFEEARKAIDDALALDSDRLWLLRIKGQVLNALEEHEQAIECFDRILSKEPEDVTALHHKGIALLGLSRNEQALELFEHVQKIEPQNVTIMVTIAFTLLFDDKYSEEKLNKALECLEQALELRPDDSWALSIKGAALCDLGEYAESIQALSQAAELDPTDIDSRTYLGWALQCHSVNLMRVLWEQQVEKGFAEKLSLRDWALRSEAEAPLQEAEKAYDAAQQIDPKNLWARKGIANSKYLLGDEDGARQIYEQVLEEAQGSGDFDAPTLALMGWCKYRLKQYDAAVRLFIDNQSLIADMAAVQFDLALALLCNRQYSPGLGQYERGVKVARERPDRRYRGLLLVARCDLLEAVIADPSMWSSPDVQAAFDLLERKLAPTPAAVTSS